jgi:hypothetical protein
MILMFARYTEMSSLPFYSIIKEIWGRENRLEQDRNKREDTAEMRAVETDGW